MSVQFTNVSNTAPSAASDVAEGVEQNNSSTEEVVQSTPAKDRFTVVSVNLKAQFSKFDFENVAAFPETDNIDCGKFRCGAFA